MLGQTADSAGWGQKATNGKETTMPREQLVLAEAKYRAMLMNPCYQCVVRMGLHLWDAVKMQFICPKDVSRD
jgi:hypothetical protein